MHRLTLTNLLANKIRVALTTFGVTLAVSFVVAAFVLADGLRSSFTGVSEDVTAGIDLEVRGVADLGETPPLPASTVATVAAVDGVAHAVATVEAAENAVRPVPPGGGTISTTGPPQLAFAWVDDPDLSPFSIVAGAPPQAGEFTLDVDSASEHGFVIGDAYEVMVPGGTVTLTLSGTSSFGDDNATLGATLIQVAPEQASELFGIDGITTVAVRIADDADPVTVAAAVGAAVPGAEVVDHDVVLEETTTAFTREIDVVGGILLGFGGVSLLVSAFIVHNTFGIVLGQRTKELALLRTVGATPRQIRRAVRGETLVMGVLASAAGLAGGIGVAKGLDALFGLMGVDLPSYPLVLAPRTLLAAAVIGVGVTLVAAAGPARRAATVPPVALLRSSADGPAVTSRRRIAIGGGMVAAGSVAGSAGIAAGGSSGATAVACAAAVAVVAGILVLGPSTVTCLTAPLGRVVSATAGVAGRLARDNARRNPRRTATTGAALMIGLALVTAALVVGRSVTATIAATFERSAPADRFLTDELDEVDLPGTLPAELRASPLVEAATGFTELDARVDGDVTDVVAFDFAEIERLIDLDLRAGAFDTSVGDPVVVSAEAARDAAATLGDHLTIEVAGGDHVDATIVGIFDDQAILPQDHLVDTAVLEHLGVEQSPTWIAVATADGAPAAAVDALFDRVAADHPQATVETAAQFGDRLAATVERALTMVNVMVGLAIVIALIGIANTSALSVFERTRELGLLRAVGMTRRQLRRMVRLEAALVAGFGATLGVAVGLVLGSGIVASLPARYASGIAVPVVPLAVVVVGATCAGVAAAVLPARRASRLDVLRAIAA